MLELVRLQSFFLCILSHVLGPSSALFVGLLCLFVCLLHKLYALREVLLVTVSCIDHVVVIWSNCCGPVTWSEWKVTAAAWPLVAQQGYKSSCRSEQMENIYFLQRDPSLWYSLALTGASLAGTATILNLVDRLIPIWSFMSKMWTFPGAASCQNWTYQPGMTPMQSLTEQPSNALSSTHSPCVQALFWNTTPWCALSMAVLSL